MTDLPKPIDSSIEYTIERDDDCDCPRWLRWRVVREETIWHKGKTDYDSFLKARAVVAHAITKLGARWKRRRLAN